MITLTHSLETTGKHWETGRWSGGNIEKVFILRKVYKWQEQTQKPREKSYYKSKEIHYHRKYISDAKKKEQKTNKINTKTKAWRHKETIIITGTV